MASEKVASILRSRGAPFTEDQISEMPDHLGWDWIYTNDKQKQKSKVEAKQPEVCFTGFSFDEKQELIEAANIAGFKVKDSVTKNLRILVVGQNPGPSKIEKAQTHGCVVTDRTGFMEYIEGQKKN